MLAVVMSDLGEVEKAVVLATVNSLFASPLQTYLNALTGMVTREDDQALAAYQQVVDHYDQQQVVVVNLLAESGEVSRSTLLSAYAELALRVECVAFRTAAEAAERPEVAAALREVHSQLAVDTSPSADMIRFIYLNALSKTPCSLGQECPVHGGSGETSAPGVQDA